MASMRQKLLPGEEAAPSDDDVLKGNGARGPDAAVLPSSGAAPQAPAADSEDEGAGRITPWMQHADVAVDFHNHAKFNMHDRASWGTCTLRFQDPVAEKAFQWYFSKLRGNKMRRGLLYVAFAYMIYALVEWGDKHYFWHLVVARSVYVVILLVAFTASFVADGFFRKHVQLCTTAILSLTGAEIVVEAALQRQVYSPFVVIILIIYLVAGSILVRVRFVFTTAFCWLTLLVYDILCASMFPHGDNNISDDDKVLRWLAWYNFIFVFVIAVLMKMSHRIEVQSRYEFLTNYWLGAAERLPAAEAEVEAGLRGTLRSPLLGSMAVSPRAAVAARRAHYATFAPTSRAQHAAAGVDAAHPSQRSASLDADYALAPIDNISRMLRDSGDHNILTFVRHLTDADEREELAEKQRSGGTVKRTMFETVRCDELPDYYVPYPFILTGYRCNFTLDLCIKSLFRLHNETFNVWSEFVPCLMAFVAFFIIFKYDDVFLSASSSTKLYLGLGYCGALVIRPLCSGLAHLLYCQSRRSYVVWWGVDYASICVCVLAAAVGYGRLTFFCLPQQQTFFTVSLVGLFASTIISVLFVSSTAVRTGSFLLFVAFANGVPFFYQTSLRLAGSSADQVPDSYLVLWLLNGALIGLGLLIKALMIPERFAPGRFDHFGASHQWWHVLITSGQALVYISWRRYLQWRQDVPC